MSEGGSKIWKTEPKTDRRVRSMSMTAYVPRNRKKERYTVSTECTDIRQKKKQEPERSRVHGDLRLPDTVLAVTLILREPDERWPVRYESREVAALGMTDLHRGADRQEPVQTLNQPV